MKNFLHMLMGTQYEIFLEPHIGLCTRDRPVLAFPRGLKRSKSDLTLLIHEALHACFTELTEDEVDRASRDIAGLIWPIFMKKLND